MAHFVQLDKNNRVTEVVVVPNEEEHRGEEFLHELGLECRWIQTSYNANFRGLYAGIGDYYNESLDMFERIGDYHHTDTEDDINAI
jgi:hypothetical protein